MYYATYHGLHKWHEHMFTHLGWMVLAKNHGYSTKIKAYIEGVQHLDAALKEAIENTHDLDRKEDLKMLLHNTRILEKTVMKMFKSKKSSRASRS